LKNATAVAVVTPMLILGVPLTDTVVAMIRRKLNGGSMVGPIVALASSSIEFGSNPACGCFSIYGIAGIFSFIALILNVIALGQYLFYCLYLIGLSAD
jgi:UDP-GlcNAc:undecaprenyl-phosphate GlcNAc-1-phosphate transferase